MREYLQVVFGLAFFLTTLGVVYVQEAERRIPMNYASRYQAGALGNQAYLPFKVNATGVMPVIFASSLMALPSSLARNSSSGALIGVANALYPTSPLYVPVTHLLPSSTFSSSPPLDHCGTDRALQLILHICPVGAKGRQ